MREDYSLGDVIENKISIYYKIENFVIKIIGL